MNDFRLEWAKMPTNWIKFDEGLKRFPMSKMGQSVTALKLYLTIVSHARSKPSPSLPAGAARLSYSDFEEVVGVSRAMLRPALDLLSPFVSVTPGADRVAIYSLLGFPALGVGGGWTMFPSGYIKRQRVVEKFSPRSRTDLGALKLYLLLLSFRENKSGVTTLSYEKIHGYSGLDRNSVSRSIGRLLDFDLIRLRSGREGESERSNRYTVLGLASQIEVAPAA